MPTLAHAAESTLEIPATQVEGEQVTTTGYTRTVNSTASKSEVPVRDEAQSVTTVTRQTLDDFQVTSLADAMKFVSGISETNTLGNTKDSIIKRGFGANDDGAILRDGVRSAVGRNLDATTDHVEVLKGPASLLYGALEPGGVINVVSKQPQFVQKTTLTGSAYSEGGGTFGVDTTGPIGDTALAYRLVAERGNEDYWRNYGTSEHTLVAPSLSWVGERANLTLAYSYNDYSSPFDRGTVFQNGEPANVSYSKRLDERWAKTVGISETASARFEYQLSDNWKTRATYGWNNDRYSLSIAQPANQTAAQLINGRLTRAANGGHYDYETRYTSLDFIGQQNLFEQRHDLLVGVDNEVQDRFRGKTYRNANNTTFNIFNPVYGNLAEPSVVSNATSNLSNEITSTSLYFKDNWHLNEQWIVVLGGRQQHYDQYSAQGLTTRVVNVDNNGDVFLPFAGLVYQPTEQWALYGNYSRSFVPNDADDQGNAFDPTEGRSYEVGAKYTPSQALNVNLALFDIEKTNVVTTNTLGASVAAGKVGSRGVELDVTGQLAPRWDMIGTYAYTHTEILKDRTNEGQRLANAPMHTASLFLSHHLALPAQIGQWHAGAGARYVGERAGDNANSYWMDSYTVADAFLRWDLPVSSYQTRLQLNVDNLFNKEYYPSSTGAGQVQVNVGEPRTARLTASVSF